MPNWCRNDVTITHDDPSMINRLINSNTGFLETFIPCPSDLTNKFDFSAEDYREKVELWEEQNLKTHGYKDWYDWRVANWGTKWDIELDDKYVSQDGKMVQITFNSAWSPPIEAYNKLKELGFNIHALYVETGNCFAGEWDDGEDFCIEYDFTDDEWADKMSDTLADYLQCEYENYQMWLEEEKEQANG